MALIEINKLTKEYSSGIFKRRKVLALSDVSLNIEAGNIFGLLGPNGAGKTTLVKVLLGIAFPTKGAAKIFGKNVKNHRIKKQIGYLPENHRYPGYLNGEEVLNYFGLLSGMKYKDFKDRIDELLSLVGLEKWKKMKIGKYSKGMMQRLGLAQSIINNPEIVFLDEPTDGVDPIGRKEIRDILLDLKNKGKTVFLNSHLLSEIELVCDRVAILNKGFMIKEGNINDITAVSDRYNFLTSDIGDDFINKLLLNYNAVIRSKNNIIFEAENIEKLNLIIDYLRKENILIHGINREKDTLENMFINLIEQQKQQHTNGN